MGSRPLSASSSLPAAARTWISAVIAVVGSAAIAWLGWVQYLKDGSFWIDEASVALSLVELSPGELFGQLVGDQSFPRFLLSAIRGTIAIFGYETHVARALPQLFFLLATIAWGRLLYLRFRDEPLLVAMGLLLLLVPSTWFIYAAMLKPYTFDVFLAAIPFLLSDDFYERSLGQGERTLRIVALTAGVAASYPFGMALLARAGGWWLTRAARGELAVSLRGSSAAAVTLGLAGACLWALDLRHTGAVDELLQGFWGKCIIGHESASTLLVLDRFLVGWWDGRTEFALVELSAPLVVGLRLCIAAGLLRVALSLRRMQRTAPEQPAGVPIGDAEARWGSRSAGYALILVGVPLASALVGYPACAGRLTLFALLPVLTVVLEGALLGAEALRRIRYGSWIATACGVALVAAIVPASAHTMTRLPGLPAPNDLRPAIAKMRSRSDLPVLSNSCTRKQIETLPEGLPVPVHYIERGGAITIALRKTRDAWLLVIPSKHCGRRLRVVTEAASHLKPQHGDRADVQLYFLRFPQTPKKQQQRGARRLDR